ncbi:hypothetical protein O181_004808 [Austropuccinia psidii MF-1]|uniref:HAT C-terminal dimerisation domain-containing protein n=1 Tax=Austropuccinia psidii MF-1 TaxID=1389203 RepID=A0A9Q3BH41_9BASI|nr:hypothetical protein [Austropuccinia psidii MF-1]
MLLTKIPAISASILDPQFKLQFYSYDTTLARFGASASHLAGIFQSEAAKEFKGSSPMPQLAEQEQRGLFDDRYLLSSEEGSSLECEIQHFFSEPPKPKSTNTLQCCKPQATVSPTLASMACKYLSIPATSAPLETVFSGGRKMITYQHASLCSMPVSRIGLMFGHTYRINKYDIIFLVCFAAIFKRKYNNYYIYKILFFHKKFRLKDIPRSIPHGHETSYRPPPAKKCPPAPKNAFPSTVM